MRADYMHEVTLGLVEMSLDEVEGFGCEQSNNGALPCTTKSVTEYKHQEVPHGIDRLPRV
jgi:hypothetical protein